MTNLAIEDLTGDHCLTHPCRRVAEVRAQGESAVPHDVEPLGLAAFAARLDVHRSTAHRRMATLAAQQHRPEVLRVVRLPVPIGCGAVRSALHVLWPRPLNAGG